MKNICLTLIAVAWASVLAAQTYKRDYQWYFGYGAAISFSSGAPVAVAGSAIYTNEGNATMSDTAGNLVFYTDGSTVWNAANIAMPNGYGLRGSNISAQSALIIPSPGNTHQYYLFTINNWTDAGAGDGLNYSIVDMTLNGGAGDVTTVKNVLLDANAREQQAAIMSADGQSVWIVTHDDDNQNFNAYQITAAGVNAVPVTSAVGMTYGGDNRFGQLHFSRSCTKNLVSVLGSQYQASETVQLLDFDNSTGVVSNPVTLATYNSLPGAYGAAFSPDNSKLYVTEYDAGVVYQYDLNNANIQSTGANIAGNNYSTASTACLGPDGKIYVDMDYNSALSVIEAPDSLGTACNFQDDLFTLTYGSCRLALPDFVTQPPAINITLDSIGTSCNSNNGTIIAELNPFDTPYRFTWSNGGNSDTLNNLAAGTYSVTVTDTSGCSGTAGTSIISSGGATVTPSINITGNDTLCGGIQATFYASVTNGGASPVFQWEINGTNAGANSNSFSYAGFNNGDTITCILTGSSACDSPRSVTSNSIIVIVNARNTFLSSIDPSHLCFGDTAVLTVSDTNFTIYPPGIVTWIDANQAILTPSTSTQFALIAPGGCAPDTNLVNITVIKPIVNITADKDTICANDSAQICASSGFSSYLWNNAENTTCIYTSEAGNYYVTATDAYNCSAFSNHLAITVNPSPSVSLSIERDTITVYNEVVVAWYENGEVIPGASGQVFIATNSGNYTVEVEGADGCTSNSNIITIIAGIQDIGQNGLNIYSISVTAFPNPFMDETNIEVKGISEKYGFELFDITGRLLKAIPGIQKSQFQLKRGALPSGLYFYRLTIGNEQVANGKLIIE